MIFIFLLSVLIMFLVVILRSRLLINFVSLGYALIVLIWSLYLLFFAKLPIYLFNNQFIFMDKFSVFEIIICAFLFLLAIIYAQGYLDCLIKAHKLDEKNVKFFYLVLNLLLLTLILVFSSNNLALLWIFAELSTVISAILIVILNTKDNIKAAIKYIFITSTAMLFSFIGLILLFAACKASLGFASLNWDILILKAQFLPPHVLLLAFVLIFIGFAAKSGLVPFHTWLPPAHSRAPSDVSALLSGCILNIGIYAIIRIYAIAYASSIMGFTAKFLLVFGIISILVAAFSMVLRTNLKKLIAFSSIENMGIILLSLSIGSLYWTIFYILSHSLAKALLFFSAGIINRQYDSVNKNKIFDILSYQPLAFWGLVFGTLTLIGMPLLPIFTAKFFILKALADKSLILVFFVLILLLIAAGSFACFLIDLVKESTEEKLVLFKAPLSMKLPIIILIITLIFLGVYTPNFFNQKLIEIVQNLHLMG